MTAFLAQLQAELRLSWRQGSDLALVVAFYVLAVTLFPLGVGPEPALLARVAPGVLWVGALLAALLSLDRLFADDHADGTLELLALSPAPLWLLVGAKILAHWIATGLPLVALSVPLALMLGLPGEALPAALLSLLLGTPCLSAVGAIGAALILGARRGQALVALLVLPLVLPVLIFGAGAIEAEATGLGAAPHLAILGALLLLAGFASPFVSAYAVRQALG